MDFADSFLNASEKPDHTFGQKVFKRFKQYCNIVNYVLTARSDILSAN